MNDSLENILLEQFNYEQFRPGQKEIIEDVLRGKDVLGILPTGSGKSICYQLPSLLLPHLTVVISPLISLMIDQVRETKAFHMKEVTALHSMQSYDERQVILQQLNRYKIVYISPELIQTDYVIEALQQQKVSLFVIDEAHCISQWGYDFRPDYLRLKNVLESLSNPPILALSGTITKQIEMDIIQELNRPNMNIIKHRTDRENIALVVERIDALEKKENRLIQLLEMYPVPTIIYFSSRKLAEEIAHLLTKKLGNRSVNYYHGGLDQASRLKIQQQFLFNQLEVICATSAFGMGINKPNVRLVVHYHLPLQKESFIQEIGRAGRDGKQSMSIVLYKQGDEYIPHQLINNELPTEKEIRCFFNYLYLLFQKNETLPHSTKELTNIVKVSDTKVKFLLYQCESKGMVVGRHIHYHYVNWANALDEIMTYCERRTETKLANFEHMLTYVYTSSCLRVELYKDFQPIEKKQLANCCSSCGYDEELLEIEGKTSQPYSAEQTWQAELATMLGIGE